MTIFQNAPGPNANAAERAQWAVDKCDEHIRLRQVGQHVRGLDRLEIDSLEHQIDGRLTCIIRAFRGPEQYGFGPGGTLDAQTVNIINPPIMVPDAAGPYVRQSTKLDGTLADGTRYREDVVEAVLDKLSRIVQLNGVLGGPVVRGSLGRTITTRNPQPGTGTAPIDGILVRSGVDEAFTTIRGGAGTSHDDTGTEGVFGFLGTFAGVSVNNFNHLQRTGIGFDTSFLGSDTINSVTLSIHGSTFDGGSSNGLGGSPTLEIVSFSPASEDDFVNGDYAAANFGTTTFATGIGIGSWTDTNYNDFTLNASGEGHIDGAGNTFFGARHNWDNDNSFGGTWSANQGLAFVAKQADFAGTVDDPELVTDHSPADDLDAELFSSGQQQPVIETAKVVGY